MPTAEKGTVLARGYELLLGEVVSVQKKAAKTSTERKVNVPKNERVFTGVPATSPRSIYQNNEPKRSRQIQILNGG